MSVLLEQRELGSVLKKSATIETDLLEAGGAGTTVRRNFGGGKIGAKICKKNGEGSRDGPGKVSLSGIEATKNLIKRQNNQIINFNNAKNCLGKGINQPGVSPMKSISINGVLLGGPTKS